MSWRVTWSRPAVKDLERLDRNVALRIHQAMERLASSGQGDIKRLRNQGGEWRLRVGDWRVRFGFAADSRELNVYRVLHRSKAYRQ